VASPQVTHGGTGRACLPVRHNKSPGNERTDNSRNFIYIGNAQNNCDLLTQTFQGVTTMNRIFNPNRIQHVSYRISSRLSSLTLSNGQLLHQVIVDCYREIESKSYISQVTLHIRYKLHGIVIIIVIVGGAVLSP
jgi:hypothetical protein